MDSKTITEAARQFLGAPADALEAVFEKSPPPVYTVYRVDFGADGAVEVGVKDGVIVELLRVRAPFKGSNELAGPSVDEV